MLSRSRYITFGVRVTAALVKVFTVLSASFNSLSDCCRLTISINRLDTRPQATAVSHQADVFFKTLGSPNAAVYFGLADGQQVSQFRYLGSLISEDGYCMKEIQSRNEMAKKVFMDKKKLFTGKMNLELKKRIMKCLVWSVALYAAETWTVTQTDRRLEAFEM